MSYTIIRSDYRSSSAWPAEPIGNKTAYDLVSLLATAQTLGIDIIALTWQPALGQMARGGTSIIQQLQVKLESSFAFKVFEYSDNAAKDESAIYRALISEITVLGQKSLRKHPNIKPVLGICWDPREDGRVWPVLVSEKSQCGNLQEFMESGEGRSLPFGARLKICVGIACAIRDMHNCHVVHGDIKPTNVLIDKNDSNDYVAKVIDFGYATLYAGAGLINMPSSPGWSAPSTRGGETFLHAKTMDAFSFSLVCKWLLFSTDPRPKGFTFSAAMPQALVHAALDLVDREEGLDEAQKQNFRCLFSSSLSLDADRRTGDFNTILDYFSLYAFHSEAIQDKIIPNMTLPPSVFSLTILAGQLYMCDIRVRTHVNQVLHEIINTSTDTDRKKLCAFEATICHAIGFGVPKDEQQSKKLLAYSDRPESDLAIELEGLKKTDTVYRNSAIAAYHAEGTIFSCYILLLAEPRSVVITIANACHRELQDIELVLGTHDSLFQILQRDYASLLLQLENFEDAEKIWYDIVAESKAMFGSHNPSTLTDMGNLAYVLERQAKYGYAEEILLEAVSLSLEAPGIGKDHQVTIARQNQLAFLKCHIGDYESAIKLHEEVLLARKKTLGENHPEVLESERGLLYAISGLGNDTEIISKWEELVRRHVEAVGPFQSETIKTRFELAEALLASNEFERVDQECKIVLGLGAMYLNEHSTTVLNCRNVHAQALLALGKAKDAETLANETLRLSRISPGPLSESTITALDGLASIKATRGNFVEAEALQREAVSCVIKTEMAETYNGFLMKNNLAITLEKLEKYEEAEKFYRQAYEGRLRTFGTAYPETEESKQSLLRVLGLQGKMLEI